MYDSLKGNSKGFTLIEMSIGLIIATLVIGAIFFVAPKMMSGNKADAIAKGAAGLITAIEKLKPNNGGAYIASPELAISAIPSLAGELGGAGTMKDLVGWTYSCVAGAGSSIIITTAAQEDTIIRDNLLGKLGGRFTPWTAAANGADKITLTRAGVNCQ